MIIFVKSIEGKTYTLNIDSSSTTTVHSVKEDLFLKTGVYPHVIHLIFAGKIMQDSYFLSDYLISKESTLHMTTRIPGGHI